jgi:hypothetical protein
MVRPFPGVEGYGSPETFTDGSMKTLGLNQLLGLILVELRMQNEMLREGLNLSENTEAFREAAFSALWSTAEIAPSTTISNPS